MKNLKKKRDESYVLEEMLSIVSDLETSEVALRSVPPEIALKVRLALLQVAGRRLAVLRSLCP